MPYRSIVMLNMGETTRDPRALRIGRTLTSLGHRVVAINPRDDTGGSPRSENTATFDVLRVDQPRGARLVGFEELERASPEAAARVRRAAPELMDLRAKPFEWARYHAVSKASMLIARAEETLHVSLGPARRAVQMARRDGDERLREVNRLRSIVRRNIALAEVAARFRPDVVHANDLDTLLAGLILKLKSGGRTRLVYDAHEIYAEQVPRHEIPELRHRFFTELERVLLPDTDLRLTVCDSLDHYFQRTYGAKPFVTVRNVPSIRSLPDASILARKSSPRVALYQGMFLKNRGLEDVIRAAPALRRGVILLRGLGYHEPVLKKLAEEVRAGDRLRFAPPAPVSELVRSASESDVGLNPFPPVCLNTTYALPNKFFEYMMAGLAVASSDLIEMRRLTDELGVGILFRALDPETIASDLDALFADPDRLDEIRRRSYEHARATFNWETEEKRLVEAYRPLLDS